MPDSARGSTSDRERQSVEEPPISAKSRSGGRCSEEEKARVIRESFRTGKRVGEPPARSRHWGQERSPTSGARRHRRHAVLRPDSRDPEKQLGIWHLRLREVSVLRLQLWLSAAPAIGHPVSGSPPLCARLRSGLSSGAFQIAYDGLRCVDGRIVGVGTRASQGWRIQSRVRRLG